MKNGSLHRLQALFCLLIASFALANVKAFAVPSGPMTANLVRIKVHKIELRTTSGHWVPFSTKLSELNINFQDVASQAHTFFATERVAAGGYNAVRMTFSRYFHIHWDGLIFTNNSPAFYYTNTHNNDESFSTPGFKGLRKLSSRSQFCVDHNLTTAEDIPVPFGNVYNSELAFAGFEQLGKHKHLLRKEFIVPVFNIQDSGALPLVNINFGTISVIFDTILLKDGSTVPVLYPALPTLSAFIITGPCS
jgi:hypothetical protein